MWNHYDVWARRRPVLSLGAIIMLLVAAVLFRGIVAVLAINLGVVMLPLSGILYIAGSRYTASRALSAGLTLLVIGAVIGSI